jgi:hypothetical protein
VSISGIHQWQQLLEGIAYLFSRRRFAEIASLVLAVIVLALGIFEGIDSSGRVVWSRRSSPACRIRRDRRDCARHYPPAYLITGFYVFLTAAVVAVIAAAMVVALTLRGNRQRAGMYSPASSAT